MGCGASQQSIAPADVPIQRHEGRSLALSASHAAGGTDGCAARPGDRGLNAGLDHSCDPVVEDEIGIASKPPPPDGVLASLRASVAARHARPHTPLAQGDRVARTLCSPLVGHRDSTGDATCACSADSFKRLLMPQAIEDASVVAAASGAKQLRAGSRPPTRGDRPGPPPAASRKPSRPGTRPSTLAVCGSSAIVAGPAPPWHRLLPSRPGGLVGSRPATAESNHTDWIMDDVSASPPPTAGGSPPMAGMGAIDGWGMTSYDLDEQAAEPNASCQAIHSSTAIYSSTGSRHGAPGGHAQVLFLDGHETEPPPAVSMLANSSAPPLTAGSPHHFAAQSTAPAAGAAATSGRRAQDGREIASSHEMPISLRGGTAGHTPTLERAPLRLRAEAAGPHATCVGCSGIFCTGGGDVVAVQVEMRTGQVELQTGQPGGEEMYYHSFPHIVPVEGEVDLRVEGLAPSRLYRVRARLADTEGGDGPWSEPTSVTTDDSLKASLAPPTVLRRGARELVIAWLPPEGASAAPAGQMFEVEMNESGAAHSTADLFYGDSAAAVAVSTIHTYPQSSCAAAARSPVSNPAACSYAANNAVPASIALSSSAAATASTGVNSAVGTSPPWRVVYRGTGAASTLHTSSSAVAESAAPIPVAVSPYTADAASTISGSAVRTSAPWRLVYSDNGTQCAVRDLQPARTFQFRVRLVRMQEGAPATDVPVGGGSVLAAVVPVGGSPVAASFSPGPAVAGTLAPRGLETGRTIGLTEWSEPLRVTTEAAVPAAPLPPAVSIWSNGAVELTWVVPEAHGSAILRHEVRLERDVFGCGHARSHSAVSPAKRETQVRAGRAVASAGGGGGRETVMVLPAVANTGGDNTGGGGTRVVAWLGRDALPGGARARVSARAVSALGEGPWSEAVSVEVAPGPPAPPARLVMQERGAREARVRWVTPANNGAPLTQAEVGLVLLSDTNTPGDGSAPGTADDLESRVTTDAARGGAPSCSAGAAATPHAPTAPHGLLGAAPLAPPPESSGAWTLAWVGESPAGEGDTAGATLRGLLPGCVYAVRVRVINTAGEGGWSAPLLLQTAGGPVPTPPRPSVAAKTSTTMSLRWAQFPSSRAQHNSLGRASGGPLTASSGAASGSGGPLRGSGGALTPSVGALSGSGGPLSDSGGASTSSGGALSAGTGGGTAHSCGALASRPAEETWPLAEPRGERGSLPAATTPGQVPAGGERMRWELQMDSGVRVKYNSDGLNAGRGGDDSGVFSSCGDFSSGVLPAALRRTAALGAADSVRGGGARGGSAAKQANRPHPLRPNALLPRLPPMQSPPSLDRPLVPPRGPRPPIKRGTRPAARTETTGRRSSLSGSAPANAVPAVAHRAGGGVTAAGGSGCLHDSTRASVGVSEARRPTVGVGGSPGAAVGVSEARREAASVAESMRPMVGVRGSSGAARGVAESMRAGVGVAKDFSGAATEEAEEVDEVPEEIPTDACAHLSIPVGDPGDPGGSSAAGLWPGGMLWPPTGIGSPGERGSAIEESIPLEVQEEELGDDDFLPRAVGEGEEAVSLLRAQGEPGEIRNGYTHSGDIHSGGGIHSGDVHSGDVHSNGGGGSHYGELFLGSGGVRRPANGNSRGGEGENGGREGEAPEFRTVYSGAAVEHTVVALMPACRYVFRVRAIDESGAHSDWSPPLAVETDTADSAHRISFREIECFEVLGEGAFSVVHRGMYKAQAVAVKRLKYQRLTEDLMGKFNQELAILSRVRHRNVVAFVGAVTEQPHLCVVMEYMEAGTLHSAIHSGGLTLTLPRLLEVALDVANGCHYLHRQKPMIVHRDLKSQNILLTRDGRCKIADFGLSKFFQQEVASMTGQIGTPGWTAPEVYKHGSYDQKVDVYSFGIVLAECLSGEKPYTGMDAVQVAFATVYRNKRPTLPPSTPPPIEKLTRLCWDADPKKRPVFAKVIDQLQGIKRGLIMNGGIAAAAGTAAAATGVGAAEREASPVRAEARPAQPRAAMGSGRAPSTEPFRTTRSNIESPHRAPPSATNSARRPPVPTTACAATVGAAGSGATGASGANSGLAQCTRRSGAHSASPAGRHVGFSNR